VIDYAMILSRRYAGNQWTLNGDDYTGLIWLSNTAKPTKTKLDSLWSEVQQEILDEQTAKIVNAQAVLDKLGITANEFAALLG